MGSPFRRCCLGLHTAYAAALMRARVGAFAWDTSIMCLYSGEAVCSGSLQILQHLPASDRDFCAAVSCFCLTLSSMHIHMCVCVGGGEGGNHPVCSTVFVDRQQMHDGESTGLSPLPASVHQHDGVCLCVCVWSSILMRWAFCKTVFVHFNSKNSFTAHTHTYREREWHVTTWHRSFVWTSANWSDPHINRKSFPKESLPFWEQLSRPFLVPAHLCATWQQLVTLNKFNKDDSLK